MTLFNDRKKALLFIVLTLSCSILLWGSLVIFRFEVPNLETGEVPSIIPMLVYILNGFMPSIIGVILYIKTTPEKAKKRLQSLLPTKQVLFPSLQLTGLFVLAFLMQTILYKLFIGSYDYTIILAQIGQLIPLIILGPLSEEIGWRGYLQDQMNQKNIYATSLFIGIIWGLWHLPLFFILGTTQQTNDVNFVTFTILTIIVSYIMTIYYNTYKGSLFLGVLIHYLYTVILSFYILGTSYSLLSDILSIIPILFIAVSVTYFNYRKSHSNSRINT